MSAEYNKINEAFVTFEVAKILQDKGYREDCRASYITDETGRPVLSTNVQREEVSGVVKI